jgi:hypothetical protein
MMEFFVIPSSKQSDMLSDSDSFLFAKNFGSLVTVSIIF